ncbi:MAG TPA: hypothetical protein VM492_08930 [Sumerlaeia bacterium]|nr:hypothetical protein [Sumerlaeia bacterium]
MNDELRDYMGRPKKYENIDGTVEMAFGVMFLSIGLMGYLQNALSEHPTWGKGLPGLLFPSAVFIPMVWLGIWVLRLVKKHVTWPRTGYVAYRTHIRPPRWTGRFVIAVAGMVVAGVAVGLILGVGISRVGSAHRDLARAGYLADYVAIYAFLVFFWGGKHPWKWLIVLVMALGFLVICLVVPHGISNWFPPSMLFAGLMCLLSGVGTLLSYLRHTQPPAREEAK